MKLTKYSSIIKRIIKLLWQTRPAFTGVEEFKKLLSLGATFELPPKSVGSIDITYKCNLKCKHCYFLKLNYFSELSDDEWINLIKEKQEKKQLLFHSTWIGGEPLLRVNLLEKLTPYFFYNIVITNGTLGFPQLSRTKYHVSIDGPREIHDKIRGTGVYDKLWRSIKRSKSRIGITTVINNLNYNLLEDFVKEWSDAGASYILFELYTPSNNTQSDSLSISVEQRDKIVDDLLRIKDFYKDFIINSPQMLQSLKIQQAVNIIKNCVRNTGDWYFYLDPLGRQKTPCVLGPGTDCYQCGCSMPYFKYWIEQHDIDTMIALWRFAF